MDDTNEARERFEKWAVNHAFGPFSIVKMTRNSAYYRNHKTQAAWDAWQGAYEDAALIAHQQSDQHIDRHEACDCADIIRRKLGQNI